MAPTTRAAAGRRSSLAREMASASTAPAATKKTTPANKSKTTEAAATKQKTASKITKTTKKPATPVPSPKSPRVPFTKYSNQASAFDDPDALSKQYPGRPPTDLEFRRVIGPNGTTVGGLLSQFKGHLTGGERAHDFFVALGRIAYIDRDKHPRLVYLRNDAPAVSSPKSRAAGARIGMKFLEVSKKERETARENAREKALTAREKALAKIYGSTSNRGPVAPTQRLTLASERYFPTRFEIAKFIGSQGTSINALEWKYKKAIQDNDKLFWNIVWQIAALDKSKHPFHVYLTGEQDTFAPEDERNAPRRNPAPVVNVRVDLSSGVSETKKKGKKNKNKKGKGKAKIESQPFQRRGTPAESIKQSYRSVTAHANAPPAPFFPARPGLVPRTPEGYAADLDTPISGFSQLAPYYDPTAPIQASKGKQRLTSPINYNSGSNLFGTLAGSIQASEGKGKAASPTKSPPAYAPTAVTSTSSKGKGRATSPAYSSPRRFTPINRPTTAVPSPKDKQRLTSPLKSGPAYAPTTASIATTAGTTGRGNSASPVKSPSKDPHRPSSSLRAIMGATTEMYELISCVFQEIREYKQLLDRFQEEEMRERFPLSYVG
ncbi:hypothetical protein M409DRAFT_57191 [Zasmidium cellare ATCC 36951]|uniref:Uncharacterized protein n=1 Tax=Zasmidium cellare ATCC 36951 TaxID=1080233 RepID=A0A6A6CCP9_ZASCE|nr:uncharacterized protein M409DRAFT_57191 [Zasmidium cellare ATCC 36951]KAF2163692.1 hypothetical protein M409DRAFT_57191 [Zasmidium cellare ATCC 36951]